MTGWLKSILGYMLIVSVTMQMLPNPKYEKYVRLFTGFLLLILMLQPVLKIRSADAFLERKIGEFVSGQERLEREIGKEGEAFEQESRYFQEQVPEWERVEIPEVPRVEVVIDD